MLRLESKLRAAGGREQAARTVANEPCSRRERCLHWGSGGRWEVRGSQREPSRPQNNSCFRWEALELIKMGIIRKSIRQRVPRGLVSPSRDWRAREIKKKDVVCREEPLS